MNPLFLADFYKVGHIRQYPEGTQQVWSNWTARYNHDKTTDPVVFLGLQYFIKKYLINEFKLFFFSRPIGWVLSEYREFISATLGIKDPPTEHIEALWERGKLPIQIFALPEGTQVPIGVPSMVITNTDADFFWLPNYLETLLSCCLWKPSTSATTALRFRRIFERHAEEAGEKDLWFIDWQGHDFSMRGMSGVEDAILSGLGHLTCFSGTDTMPAILAANKYYHARLTVGGSVPATEHSVMQAGGAESEYATFKRLITETYPSGTLSIVSDTWNLWRVLTDYMPRLKKEILRRPGKIVIRPDSGDPVKIICGDPDGKSENEKFGVAELLLRVFGVADDEPPSRCFMLNKVGMIYGDAITPARADAILTELVDNNLSPYNMVFGIGSYSYEMVTRDTHGHAMKATAVRRNGQVVPIFKNPVTGDGSKKSLKGIPIVHCDDNGELFVTESVITGELYRCAYQHVYRDGELLIDEHFDEIRKRVRS